MLFKLGDRVICVKESKIGYFGKLGEIYTVNYFESGTFGRVVKLHEDPKGDKCDAERFKLNYLESEELPAIKETSENKKKALSDIKILEEKIQKLKDFIKEMN